MEFAKQRLAGGVSVGTQYFEGGLGAIYSENKLGVTGYVQSMVGNLSGRVQVDLMSDRQWIPQLIFGMPLQWEQFRIEPHLLWAFEEEESTKPRLGLKLQYVF